MIEPIILLGAIYVLSFFGIGAILHADAKRQQNGSASDCKKSFFCSENKDLGIKFFTG